MQLAEQIFIANQDQGEGRLTGEIEAQEQSEFLECAVRAVLGVIQDNDQGLAIVLGQIGGEFVEVAISKQEGKPISVFARESGIAG